MSDAADNEPWQGKRTRQRDSMLLMGTIKAAGDEAAQPRPIRIRNLSSTGLMAEAQFDLGVGASVEIGLRGIDVVLGEVVWANGGKVGIRFRAEIDPTRTRTPIAPRPEHRLREFRTVDQVRRPGLRID